MKESCLPPRPINSIYKFQHKFIDLRKSLKMSDLNVAKYRGAANDQDKSQDQGAVSSQRLKAFIERIERLEEEKAGLAEDIKDIYAESKGVGFDTKTIRKVIRLRKMDVEKRREEDELLELYKSAIGLE